MDCLWTLASTDYFSPLVRTRSRTDGRKNTTEASSAILRLRSKKVSVLYTPQDLPDEKWPSDWAFLFIGQHPLRITMMMMMQRREKRMAVFGISQRNQGQPNLSWLTGWLSLQHTNPSSYPVSIALSLSGRSYWKIRWQRTHSAFTELRIR